jgi:hypothetical protein
VDDVSLCSICVLCVVVVWGLRLWEEQCVVVGVGMCSCDLSLLAFVTEEIWG